MAGRQAALSARLVSGSSVLRPWQDGDRASLITQANNRKVWRNLKDRFPHPYTERDADDWLALARSNPGRTNWAIEVDGFAVGGVGLEPMADVYARTAHLGYWLGEPYWGRGIMSDAVRVVATHALGELGFMRLEAPVFAWNPASMRVLEKCGFAREGVMRHSVFKDGELIDSVLYARVAS